MALRATLLGCMLLICFTWSESRISSTTAHQSDNHPGGESPTLQDWRSTTSRESLLASATETIRSETAHDTTAHNVSEDIASHDANEHFGVISENLDHVELSQGNSFDDGEELEKREDGRCSATPGDLDTTEFKECKPDLPPCFECTCTDPFGYIYSEGSISDPRDFTVDVGEPELDMMVWFNKIQIVGMMEEKCLLVIGGTTFDIYDDLHETTFVYIKTGDKISTYTNSDPGAMCQMCIYYAAVVPETKIHDVMTDYSGGWDLPAGSLSTFGYLPQQRIQWTLSLPEGFVIELNISKLDLGYRRSDLHWRTTLYNMADGDFLLIGLGTEILDRTDLILYGQLFEPTIVQINYPSAHLVFYGTYHEQYSTGFSVSYTSKNASVPITTTAAPTTLVPPVTTAMPMALAVLQDALQDKNSTATFIKFVIAVAAMANDYINMTGIALEEPPYVTPSDVVLRNVSTCLGVCYSPTCAAFNFSINKLNADMDDWAFSADALNQMIRSQELQHHWSVINDECEFCEEDEGVGWLLVGGAAALVVVIGVLVSLVAWKLIDKNVAARKREECEEEQLQKRLEKKRTSSTASSKIGGEKGVTRFSLPFSGGRHSVDSQDSDREEEEKYDMADFTEFDPNSGFDDFGLGADLLDDSRASRFYSNPAFEADSPSSPQTQVKYREMSQALQFHDQPSTSGQQRPPAVVFAPPPFKSSLKKRSPPPDVAAEEGTSSSPRQNNRNLFATGDEGTSSSRQKGNVAPLQRSFKKKIIPAPVLEEEDEDDASFVTDSDDDSDGTVIFQHPNSNTNRKQILIHADVHKEEIGESEM